MIRQKGFSLIELAIGLLILGIVLTSFSRIFELVFDTDHIKEERHNIETIQKSMATFLAVNAYLPCPDTDGDGLENRSLSGTVSYCTNKEGTLPYSDFALPEMDAWGNPYYYRVHQRAASASYVNEICEPASVMGKSGARGITSLWMCPATNLFYCSTQAGCDSVCSRPSVSASSAIPTVSETCTNTVDPRPAASLTSAPYFHLATRPFGSISGAYNIVVNDESGVQLGEGVVAVVASWGANGKTVNRSSCTGGSVAELENCDNDRNFVDTRTGEDRDFITWITVNQAKLSVIGTGEFR